MEKIFTNTKYSQLSEVDYKIEVFSDSSGNLKFYGWGPGFDESNIELTLEIMEKWNVQNINSRK